MLEDVIFEVGFVGLGKMGHNMTKRITQRSDIKVIGYDSNKEEVERGVKECKITPAYSIREVVEKMSGGRKTVWLMLPSKYTQESFLETVEYLKNQTPRNIIIDGSNSDFEESKKRSSYALKNKVDFLDCGVSGGILAKDVGYPLMVGGNREAYNFCYPLFEALGSEGSFDLVSEEAGAGHFTKMCHNSIEYGQMQAISEGFNLLKNGSYKEIDLEKAGRIFKTNSIIAGTLMDVTYKLLNGEIGFEEIAPYIDENGEGEWAIREANKCGIPYFVNSAAVNIRRVSRGLADYSFRLIAGMRKGFGGHDVRKVSDK